jgi:hypothetical protein
MSKAYRDELDRFQERQALIEAHLVQGLNSAGFAHSHLTVANRELSLNIGAALALGDIQFLGTDIEWVRELLRNYRGPEEALYDYLGAYHQAASEQLGTEGPVVDWLGELIGGYAPA